MFLPQYISRSAPFIIRSQAARTFAFRGCYSHVPFCPKQLPFGSSCPTKIHLGGVLLSYSCDVCTIEPGFTGNVPSRESDLVRPPVITLVIAHLSVWYPYDSHREYRRNRPHALVFFFLFYFVYHHIDFLVASNTTEHHAAAALFSAVSCFHSGMHCAADVCRFIEAAHYKQKVSAMMFTI